MVSITSEMKVRFEIVDSSLVSQGPRLAWLIMTDISRSVT